MGLRRSMMRNLDRIYSPFVQFITLRHRNADGTIADCVEVRWRGQWQEITETVQGTSNESITVTSRTWRLFRKDQDRVPNDGDQIVDRKGQVWEIVGPVEHHLRNVVFLCPTIQSDMVGKLAAL